MPARKSILYPYTQLIKELRNENKSYQYIADYLVRVHNIHMTEGGIRTFVSRCKEL